MKKQFAIKAIQASKKSFLFAAKDETASVLKFLAGDGECCPWLSGKGTATQTNFTSLSA